MRRQTIKFRRLIHRSWALQIGLIIAFWSVGEAIVRTADLPFPGGVVGMLIVLALLASGRVSRFSLQRGAEWLMAEMLLFFVPTVLVVLDHREFFGLLGVKILLVIVVGTLVVMAVTALTVDLCYRLQSHYAAR